MYTTVVARCSRLIQTQATTQYTAPKEIAIITTIGPGKTNKHLLTSRSRCNMKRSPPSVIPLNYDYQNMSPSSTANCATRSDANAIFYDNQYQSLFGDPVPPTPSEDYLGNLDGSLYGSFRRDSYASAIADDFNRTITLAVDGGRRLSRLFSETPITSTSVGLSPRMAPDIQILPDSGSGNSSSDARNSPNYALLRPDVPSVLSIDETFDAEQAEVEGGMADYGGHERPAIEAQRRISIFSDDVKSNRESMRESPPEIPEPPSRYTRQISNESYSSAEWFKPMSTYPEFTKMPKLRPSSKNVLSIKHHSMPSDDSPVAAMIHDSNGSSSGEDQRKLDPIPARPPDPKPSRLRSLHRQSSSTDLLLPSLLPSPPPPPPPPAPLTLPPPEPAPPPPISRQMSPIILTDAITTGAEHRVTAPRTHKKTSFTIIGEKSPQSSRAQSPQKMPLSGRISPFRGHGFREPEKHFNVPASSESSQKPVAKPRMLQQKSLSTTHLKLPSISGPSNMLFASDDSPRPSVQFNMSGKRAPMQMTHQKSILQTGKDPSSSSQETPMSTQVDPLRKMSSCDPLPLITDPYRTAIPRLSAPSTRPIVPNTNPTRRQRGLLRVINSADSNSRIPVRSNWASMDDLSSQRKPILSPLRIKSRRRSSSTSPERRSSTQTEPRSSIASDRRSSNLSSVTTSDFSFRRNSVSPVKTPQATRRKSMFQPDKMSRSTPASPSNRLRASRAPRKVAKPTTLSPIIGTPNKDLPATAQGASHPISVSLSRRESLSKIPVLNSPNGASRSNSRLSSHGNSRVSSRSSSPFKDFGASQRISSSRSPSQQSLRPESRLTSRGGSRPNSRAESNKAPSRSTSRASTRQTSRPPTRPGSRAVSQANSRASSRPTSRMEQAKAIANSRSNSRLSTRSESPIKSRKLSPPKTRRRSKSSTRINPAPSRVRRKSISPTKMMTRTPVPQRRNSKTRIPARIPTTNASPKPKVPAKTGLRRESPKRVSDRKQPISAKKTASKSVTNTGTKTGVKKPSTDANNASKTPLPVKKPASKTSTVTPGATTAGMKSRQSSNLQSRNVQKTATELKRESSSVRQANIAAALLKKEKEASSLSIKQGDAKGGHPSTNQAELQPTEETQQTVEAPAGPTKQLKRQPSTLTLLSIGSKLNLLRKRSDSNLSKKLDEMKKNGEHGTDGAETEGADVSTNGKLVALTKPNVVSMTTAAITAQPVQISTVLANQLPKTSSSGQLLAGQEDMALPAAILEKSQKTLENIQKTVTEATDEIQKTINENLTNLKTLESDMEKMAEELSGSPSQLEKSDSLTTVIEKQSPTNAGRKAAKAAGTVDDAFGEHVQTTHPIDASVTVVNPRDSRHPPTENGHNSSGATGAGAHSGATGGLAVDEDSAERSNDTELIEEVGVVSGHTGADGDSKTTSTKQNSSGTVKDGNKNAAGAAAGEKELSKEAGSQDPLDEEKERSKGCCKCSSCFCVPCRRSRCCNFCRKKQQDPEAAALATVEVVDEKVGCWKRMKCCKRKPKPTTATENPIQQEKMETISEEPHRTPSYAPPKQSKCGLCLSKVFCCRSVNKVEAVSGDTEEVRKCCFCIPCRKKRTPTRTTTQPAWEDPEHPQEQVTESSTSQPPVVAAPTPAKQGGCCSMFFRKLNCCKKKPPISESRRASMKQGNVPPPEDNRRKLHVDLIEYNSKMKGAIPVMPLSLAWFCAICNTLVPGLGTLLSGFFCICVGIPRFTQYDSAKARLGSFIINCIVAVAQLFCVLFCFVGWGWSIWWGTIMLKTAKKLSKIRKVEKLEMEEEQRQAEMAAAAALNTTDVEAGKA